ncbi:hypothetical protein Smp_000700 [Schistosoma mansoni]|uniref:hypothetical protein n=1 Tax=Schistosoma mansoni TaxID=6183 RepID=UPI0001A616D8|nr:hypothetical protein Smp_000700 [Schistosoma mansoni]|eukprot:XP_018646295.1 hypothetical protein Smp_000700 [Schistosoma mansoni]
MVTPNPTDLYRFCDLVMESVVKMSPPSYDLPWLPGFEECKTDYERIKKFMSMPFLRQFKISISGQSPAAKNDSIAKQKREHGNEAWRTNNLSLALRYYTEAIFFAASPEEKALGYGNRSCVLSRIGVHEAVLQDIDLAIKYNFPKDRRPRLFIRRSQSLISLKRFKEALIEFNNCMEYMKSENLTIPNNLNEAIQKGIKDCSTMKDELLIDDSVIPYFVHEAKSLIMKHGNTQKIIIKNCNNSNNGSNITDHNLHPSILRSLYLQDPPAVRLNYNDEFGWHIVATKNIQPGELLILDKPYSCRLHYSRLLLNCYRCSKRCINPIPCRSCTQVGFCSESCEQEAWNPVWTDINTSLPLESTTDLSLPCHRFECGLVDRLIIEDYAGWKRLRSKSLNDLTVSMKKLKSFIDKLSDDDVIGGPNISWLAFALLTKTAPNILNRLIKISLNKLTCQNDEKPISKEELSSFTGNRVVPQQSWDDYTTVDWLITNSVKRKTSDLWQRTVVTVYLTFCLEAGGYPITKDIDDNGQSNCTLPFNWASTCILHHLQCISSNGHSLSLPEYIFTENTTTVHNNNISDKQQKIPGIDLNKLTSNEISTCLYPVLSLINHSCDPNITNVTIDKFQCAIYSIRPIEQNEIIYGNYGLHYAIHSLNERQSSLQSQYHFRCICLACIEDWSPLITTTTNNNNMTNSSKDFQLKCLTCSGLINFGTLLNSDNKSSLRKVHYCQCSQPIQLKSLNTEHLYNILQRPCNALDWLQEMLKQLLDLQHTGWSYESKIIRSAF